MEQFKIEAFNTELLLVQIKKNAYNFDIYNTYRKELRYLIKGSMNPITGGEKIIVDHLKGFSTLQKLNIICTLTEIKDELVRDFVEPVSALESNVGIECFRNYEDSNRYCVGASVSFFSLLEYNRIQTNQEWLILELIDSTKQ